jgi:hypothetical protein
MNSTARIYTCVLTCMLVLGGSSAGYGKSAPEVYSGRAIFQSKSDAAACKGGQALPLLAALLPIVVNQGLSFIQKLIAEKAASYEATVTATSADTFIVNCGPPESPNLQPRLSGINFGYGPVSGTAPQDLDSRFKALGFTGKPKLYVEGHFQFVESAATKTKDADKQAVAMRYARFIPTTLEYNSVLAKSGADKDLLVALTFNFPSAYQESNAKQTTTTSSKTSPSSAAKPKTVSKASADAKQSVESGNKSPAQADGGKGKDPTTGDTTSGTLSDSASTASSIQPTISGSTQTVVLPLFEHMAAGTRITLDTLTTGWFLLPQEQPGITIENKDVTLPVNLNVIVKETEAGHGADVWLAVSDSLASNSSSIASAILGKSSSSGTSSGGSVTK